MKPIALLILLCIFADPVFAQDHNASPIGAIVVPTTDIVMFDAPPNLAFQAVPVARAVLQPNADGNTVFALQPDSNAPSGYSFTGHSMPTPAQLTVTDYIDIYQDKALNRWVMIAPQDGAAEAGWVLWGEAGQSPQGFTVISMGGN